MGDEYLIKKSTKAGKKYMLETPTGRLVHFGASGYEDFLTHGDEARR